MKLLRPHESLYSTFLVCFPCTKLSKTWDHVTKGFLQKFCSDHPLLLIGICSHGGPVSLNVQFSNKVILFTVPRPYSS